MYKDERYIFEYAFSKDDWNEKGTVGMGLNKKERLEKFLKAAMKNGITERQRECIERYYIKRMSVKEIAEELNLSTPTVYKHIRKGKESIKALTVYFN